MSQRTITTELRILLTGLLDWRSCLLSKLVLLLGIGYLFVPIDLIPDRIPIIGHFDEIGFVMGGFVGSRYLIPKPSHDRYLDLWDERLRLSICPGRWQQLQFLIRIARADFANFFLYQYRRVHAFLITGKNSGTHWLKFMLSCALAQQHNVPLPLHSSGRDADAIISHPRWPHRYPDMPRIGSSHTIPSIAFTWPWLTRALPFRPVVVLVRDISAAMASHYVKWQHEYQVQFAYYVRGDPSGEQYRADIWWYMHFFNRWGDLATAHPDLVLVMRYEDLKADPEANLRRAAAHLQIEISNDDVATALRLGGRDVMRTLLDPTNSEIVIPSDDVAMTVVYSPDDEAFMRNAFARYLRHDFGYGRSADRPVAAGDSTLSSEITMNDAARPESRLAG
jgi:hypothetical protein